MSARNFIRNGLPPIVPAVVVTAATELAVRQGWVPSFLVPAPSSVVASLFHDWPELWGATLNTANASLVGFAMSAVIAPLLVIWFGWDRTVVASAFIVSIFPVIANTLTGLLSTDPALRDLFRLYDAKRLATLFKLRLPFALPHIMTGLRIAAGLAVIGAIVGEFITGSGIGGSIMVSRQQNRVDKVFAGLLLASLLGIVLFTLINLISRLALRHWHASEAET